MRLGVGAYAVSKRDEDAGVAEADDILAAFVPEGREDARMPVDAPSGIVAEIGDCEPRGAEGAAARCERDVDAPVAETDDVFAGVAGYVADQADVLSHPPAAGDVLDELRIGSDRRPRQLDDVTVRRRVGDVLRAGEIVEYVADRIAGGGRRAGPRDQVVVIPSPAGYPPQLVDMAIDAEIDHMLGIFRVEDVTRGVSRRERRARPLP